ncbi:MAG: hypothetical protein U5K33_06730 [Halofilum sp. (in: g-proteobacteria)]|nr:hypothetical protein [Halofilum sp. (in: g-proteobacteria)]
MATIFAPLVYLPLLYLETRRAVDLPLLAFLGLLWRPLAGAGIMHFVIIALHPASLDSAALRLLCDMLLGTGTYALVVLGLWRLSGRPDGAESACLDLVGRRINWRPSRPGGTP